MGKFDTTLGALCVAYVLAWGLFGVTSMQSFSYFQKFSKDSVWMKSLVGGLWVLDTLQLALIGHVLYYWVITNYTNPAVLGDSVWWLELPIYTRFTDCLFRSLTIGVLVTNTIVLIVELFLARRVYIRKMFSPWFSLFLTWTTWFQLQKTAFYVEFQWISSVGLACASAADTIIAISLSYYLWRSRTGIKTTDSIVNMLILYALNTGLLTGICVLIDMICFLNMPTNFVHLAFNLVTGKLYTNSLLATLNYKHIIRGNKNHIHTFSLSAMPSTFQAATNTDCCSPSRDHTLNIASDSDKYNFDGGRAEMEEGRTQCPRRPPHLHPSIWAVTDPSCAAHYPNPPPTRSDCVMLAGNVVSNAIHDELRGFFTQPGSSSAHASDSSTDSMAADSSECGCFCTHPNDSEGIPGGSSGTHASDGVAVDGGKSGCFCTHPDDGEGTLGCSSNTWHASGSSIDNVAMDSGEHTLPRYDPCVESRKT
ncbi:hypothetical protein K438DRAFT_2032082 [Mycena galopus ATCC 62051]|nr:hypothetical protein K438DRAFT_2032082 [Mycena galopus ATCC 62051]